MLGILAQNHRMVGIGRDLWRPSGPPLCSDRVTWSHLLSWLFSFSKDEDHTTSLCSQFPLHDAGHCRCPVQNPTKTQSIVDGFTPLLLLSHITCKRAQEAAFTPERVCFSFLTEKNPSFGLLGLISGVSEQTHTKHSYLI